MSLKKTVAIAAAVGALAAISVPAMAMENEFHGFYNLKYFIGNYEAGGSAYIIPGTAPAAGNTIEKHKANNYFEQRARLFYTAKASDDLKLVLGFEIDSVWGDRQQGAFAPNNSAAPVASNYQGAFRNSGGAMDSDAVNLETKHVYLDFKIPSTSTRATVGIQAYKDVFKGIFVDVDLAGINTVTKLGDATVSAAYFRAYDQSYFATNRPRGVDDLHIGALTGNFAINKDLNVGAAYYLYADTRNEVLSNSVNAAGAANTTPNTRIIHVLGATVDAKVGALGLSGFAAMQQGQLKGGATKVTYNGYAFNAAAKMPVGPGTFRTAFLLTTGDDGRDNINTAWQGVQYSTNAPAATGGVNLGGNTYNESNMMLLNRAAQMGGSSTDYSIVYSSNNRDQGAWLYTLGYDAKLGAKAYANANLGFAWASKDTAGVKPVDSVSGTRGGSNFQGTELNIETGYKMYDNLTAKFQAAYVILGGYYKNTVAGAKDPDNPYTIRTGLSYTF